MIAIESKWVTLSALVHSATFPVAANVLSVAVKSCLPSNETVNGRPRLAGRACAIRLPATLIFGAGELLALALHHAIEADIVFERVGSNDVIVIRCSQPDRDPAGLIDLARDRLEADHDIDVSRRRPVRKPPAGSGNRSCPCWFARWPSAGRGGIVHDPPFRCAAFAGAPKMKPRWFRPGLA